jgi:hypothetical protein
VAGTLNRRRRDGALVDPAEIGESLLETIIEVDESGDGADFEGTAQRRGISRLIVAPWPKGR